MSSAGSEEKRIETADWEGKSSSQSAFFDNPEIQQRFDDKLRTALAEFAAGAGHEINNPLAIIGGHAQMLLDEIENPSQKRRLAVILAQVKRAYEMIADVRQFARPPKPEWTAWNPALRLEEFCTKWRAEHSDYPLFYQFQADEDAPAEIQTDPAMIGTILDALLKNAEQALSGSSDRQIELSALVTSEGITIRVCDNGPGIPEAIREQIFLPYFSGRSSGRGLGFGLPKAAQFVRQLGGRLLLEPGEKTVFSVFIPYKSELRP